MKHFVFEVWQKIIFVFRLFYSFLNGGEKCIVCGRTCNVVPVCRECRHNFFDVRLNMEAKRCSRCGKILISTEETCSECRETVTLVHTDKVLPLFSYLLWNKEILFMWKINNVRSLSSFFAEKVCEALLMLEITTVIPVPPRPGKIQKNGWDQVDELCKFLEFRYGFTVLKILERTSVNQQKKMNRKERFENMKTAYKLVDEKELAKKLRMFEGAFPSEVCIIDDVCTTGATLERCAEILKGKGVKKVSAVTLFAV